MTVVILIGLMILALCVMHFAGGDEISVSAARAAGDATRQTIFPWGCSGWAFLAMLAFAGLGVLAVLGRGA